MLLRTRSVYTGLLAALLGAALWPAHAQPPVTSIEASTDTEYTVDFTIDAPDPWPQGEEIRLLFDRTDSGEGYALVLRAGKCRLARTAGSRLQPLGDEAAYDLGPGPWKGYLKRRQTRISAILGGVEVATAVDGAHHGGAVAWSSTKEGLALTGVLVQPVAGVEMTDDFVRETTSAGAWHALGGDWQTEGINSEGPDPSRSANPFSLKGTGNTEREFALAAAGDWFWDDYQLTTAAKGGSEGAIGVAAYVQDADNFLLFRWTATGEVAQVNPYGRKQLIRVRNGRWTLLAEAPGGFFPDHWYELGISVCDGWVRAYIDGQPSLQAHDDSFGQGEVGLFGQVAGGAYFDDVVVRSTRSSEDQFTGGDSGWWTAGAGDWTSKLDHLYGAIKGKTPAQAAMGDPDWSRYELAADVKPKTATGIGLAVCCQADGAQYTFRWRKDGRQLLALEQPSGSQVLAEARQAFDDTRFYRIALRAIDGRLSASVDGQTVLEVAHTQLTGGQVGLLTESPGEACFDDVTVTFDESRAPEFVVTDQFTKEETMTNWVDAARQWSKGEDGTLWFDMPMFGDFTVWLPETDIAAASGKLTAVIAPAANAGPTAQLTIETQGGQPTLKATGFRGAEQAAASEAEVAGNRRLRLVRSGQCLSICAGDRPLLAYTDAGVLGRGFGLKIEGFPVDVRQVRVSSPHFRDMTFSGAPTDWSPRFGVWEITDRWPCALGWSWFGGKGHESPLLWSKDILEGDQVFEFWAGLLMDLPAEPGYSHPSDINGIICGDGQNLCSGYSVILAGDNNTKSKLLKGNEVVGENPNVKFIKPVSYNFEFHRHWFNVRVEKTGGHVRYLMDGRLVAEWTDNDPPSGGKVGFWTWQSNGLFIARARMAAERIHR